MPVQQKNEGLVKPECLAEELVRECPHVCSLFVICSPAVPAFNILPVVHYRGLFRSGLLQKCAHHLTGVSRVNSVVTRGRREEHFRALPVRRAGVRFQGAFLRQAKVVVAQLVVWRVLAQKGPFCQVCVCVWSYSPVRV